MGIVDLKDEVGDPAGRARVAARHRRLEHGLCIAEVGGVLGVEVFGIEQLVQGRFSIKQFGPFHDRRLLAIVGLSSQPNASQGQVTILQGLGVLFQPINKHVYGIVVIALFGRLLSLGKEQCGSIVTGIQRHGLLSLVFLGLGVRGVAGLVHQLSEILG